MKQLSPKEVAERTGGNHAHMPTKGWEQKQAWAVIEPAE